MNNKENIDNIEWYTNNILDTTNVTTVVGNEIIPRLLEVLRNQEKSIEYMQKQIKGIEAWQDHHIADTVPK